MSATLGLFLTSSCSDVFWVMLAVKGPQMIGWQQTRPCPDWFLLFFSSHRSLSPRPVLGLLPGSGLCATGHPQSIGPGFRKNRKRDTILPTMHQQSHCCREGAMASLFEQEVLLTQRNASGFLCLETLRSCGGRFSAAASDGVLKDVGIRARLYYTFMLHVGFFLIFSTVCPSSVPHQRQKETLHLRV